MPSRLIRVSSRATGRRRTIPVHVYDTLEEMRAASEAYNREPVPHALGICQARNDDHGNPVGVLIRISREYLGTAMIAHEDGDLATAHLTHHNEQAAHLHSDLLERLMTRLHALGYYEE